MKPNAAISQEARPLEPREDNLLIRPARREDLASIRDLLIETWHDTYDAIYGRERVTAITEEWHALDRLAGELDRKANAFLVGEARDASLLSTASATLRDSGVVTLGRLYVRSKFQGQGFGSAMLRACENWFPQARSMRLEIETKNAKARRFYAKRGFRELPEVSQSDEGQNILCQKPLAFDRERSSQALIRPVRDEDAQQLLGLVALCFAEYPGCLVDPHDDLADLVNPASTAAENGKCFWVVEDGAGRIGACISLDYPTPETAELHRVYVRPDMRRRGLAGKLVALAESEAGRRGAKRMFFWSDTRFLAAHQFYGQLSYRLTGEERDLRDVSCSREYRFEKAL